MPTNEKSWAEKKMIITIFQTEYSLHSYIGAFVHYTHYIVKEKLRLFLGNGNSIFIAYNLDSVKFVYEEKYYKEGIVAI